MSDPLAGSHSLRNNGHSKIHHRSYVLFALLASVPVLVPRFSWAIAIAIGVTALIGYLQNCERPRVRIQFSTLAVILFAFVAYLFLNSFWAIDSLEALGKTAFYFVLFATILIASEWLSIEPERGLRIVVAGLLAGAMVALTFVLFEEFTGQAIKRFSYNLFPILRSDVVKHFKVVDDVVVAINFYDLNRNVGLAMLLFWPSMIAISVFFRGISKVVLMVMATLLFVLIALASDHESSMLAISASLVVFGLCWLWPLFGKWGVPAMWCIMVLLAVPLALMTFKADVHHINWLPNSARARIILWDVTAKRVLDTPVLGIGINSTRKIHGKTDFTKLKKNNDEPYPRMAGRHAHNFYLQTWYELGAIGALFLFSIGLLVLRRIENLPNLLKPYTYAAFMLMALMVSTSWGMFQVWFISGLAISVVLMLMALSLARKTNEIVPGNS